MCLSTSEHQFLIVFANFSIERILVALLPMPPRAKAFKPFFFRFSSDMDEADIEIAHGITGLLIDLAQLTASFFVIITTLPLFLAFFIPLVIFYVLLYVSTIHYHWKLGIWHSISFYLFLSEGVELTANSQ